MLGRQNEDEIMDVIYKKIKDEPLTDKEEKVLLAWKKKSVYYAALMDEISSNNDLRARLLGKYVNDKVDFWREVVTYRAALHDGIRKRKGFFSFFRKG